MHGTCCQRGTRWSCRERCGTEHGDGQAAEAQSSLGQPGAASIGKCDGLTGRALGLVHRIDHGNIQLCAQLGQLFNTFAGAGCLDLLNNGKLFLTEAVIEYQLACAVFTEDCHFEVPPPACVFK